MRNVIIFVLTALVLAMSVSVPAYARGHHGHHHHHGHVRISGGVWLGPGWGAAWPVPYYPSYYPYYRNPYYAPRVIVEERPQEFISRENQVNEEGNYWYYCRKPEGYYPYIKECPGGWMKVIPPPAAPQGEE